MEEQKGGLDFGNAQLKNVTEGATRVFNLFLDGILPVSIILLFILCVGLSGYLARKSFSESALRNFAIPQWPVVLRFALFPLLTAYALTHAFSAATVYYNTQLINPDSIVYFQNMGVGRLMALSHAHFFAHATMYFLMAILVQFTSAGLVVKLYAPLAALWAGVFDVFAWWGIKELSPNFEWLSALNGSLFSIAFLAMSFAILRDAFFIRAKKIQEDL